MKEVSEWTSRQRNLEARQVSRFPADISILLPALAVGAFGALAVVAGSWFHSSPTVQRDEMPVLADSTSAEFDGSAPRRIRRGEELFVWGDGGYRPSIRGGGGNEARARAGTYRGDTVAEALKIPGGLLPASREPSPFEEISTPLQRNRGLLEGREVRSPVRDPPMSFGAMGSTGDADSVSGKGLAELAGQAESGSLGAVDPSPLSGTVTEPLDYGISYILENSDEIKGKNQPECPPFITPSMLNEYNYLKLQSMGCSPTFSY